MVSMDLMTSGLRPSVLATLYQQGFRTNEDLKCMTARSLANETKISIRDAMSVTKWASNTEFKPPITTASDPSTSSYISLLVPEWDNMMNGGIAIGEVTEISGAPGLGKTQAGIQLCLSSVLHNDNTSAIYIDTEGSFMIQRVYNIARSLCNNRSTTKDANSLLSSIHYVRVHDYQELVEVLESIDFLIKEHSVKIVVVDSIAFHFRHEFENMALRSKALASIAAKFHSIASSLETAVVLVNQVTTKVDEQTSSSTLVPALGELWSHAVTSRVILSKSTTSTTNTTATLVKSPYCKTASIDFTISGAGIKSANSQKRPRYN